MSEIITCPSGLSGHIRGMKVREERVLGDRKLAKNGGQVDELLGACWEETLDPGPYDFGDKVIDWGQDLQGGSPPSTEHDLAIWQQHGDDQHVAAVHILHPARMGLLGDGQEGRSQARGSPFLLADDSGRFVDTATNASESVASYAKVPAGIRTVAWGDPASP